MAEAKSRRQETGKMPHTNGNRSKSGEKRRRHLLAMAKSGGALMGVEALRRARKKSRHLRHEEDGRLRHRLERHHVHQDLQQGKWD